MGRPGNPDRQLNQPDRAGILVRVSTDAQASDERTSLDYQERICCEEMHRQGIPVVKVYREKGVSGGLYRSRDELQKALRDLQSGLFNVFVVADLSRSARDVQNLSDIRKRVERARGKFYSCDLGEITRNPESRLSANIRGSVDEYERERIRERTMRGRREQAQKGLQPCRSISPYGYRIVQRADVIRGEYPAGSEGQYVAIEEEAAHVRALFQWYAWEGVSLAECCVRLGAAGAITRGGGPWCRRTVLKMLSNPTYKGEATFGATARFTEEVMTEDGGYRMRAMDLPAPRDKHVAIPVPALVDGLTWERVQERRQENIERLSGRPDNRRMLTGLLWCDSCGDRVRLDARTCKTAAFICKSRPAAFRQARADKAAQEGRIIECRVTRFRLTDTEQLVAQAIHKTVTSPEHIAAAIRVHLARLQGTTEEREQAERQQEELRTRLERVAARESATVRAQIDAIGRGIDSTVYLDQLSQIAREKRQIEDDLRSIQAAHEIPAENLPDPEKVASFVARSLALTETILMSDQVPATEKNEALMGIIERIDLIRGETVPGRQNRHPGAVKITYRPLFPPNPGSNTRASNSDQLCTASRS